MLTESRLRELLLRWEELREQGNEITLEALCADCPEHLPELHRRIAALEVVDKRLALTADADAASPSAPPTTIDARSTESVADDPWATAPPSGAAVSSEIPALPGYEIESELGRGGMGVVYKARHVQLNRPVALKMVLEGSFATTEQRLRFLIEAEMAARVKHPNIAQVYEIGTHENRPYYALEFVSGGSLHQKLRVQRMSPREAAELMESLARAVQAAHAQGIIHRDLKPANVLLEPDGTPKITDFGLAKKVSAANGEGPEQAGLTATGAIMGTPSYMAPEQAQGKAKDVGPSADIYALGAILYELLTGCRPFTGTNAMEVVMKVLHEEPPPPRQHVADVPCDLEVICLKCLCKEPVQRYSTSADLADDLRRFLEDRPIVARPAGRVERAWRWCRRNRAVAALTGAVSASLLMLVAGLTVGLIVVSNLNQDLEEKNTDLLAANEREKGLTKEAQDSAKAAKESESDMMAAFSFVVEDMLAVARPQDQAGGAGIEVTVRQALDRAAPKVKDRFAGRPRAEVEARAALGGTYLCVGDFESGVRELERAYELRLAALGKEHISTTTTLNNLALGYFLAGRTPEAINAYERCIEELRAYHASEQLFLWKARRGLANAYCSAGRPKDAIRLQEQVRDAMTDSLGPDHAETLLAVGGLAHAYQEAGRSFDTLQLSMENLKLCERVLGKEHPDTLRQMHLLAQAYQSLSRHREATPLFEEVTRLMKLRLGSAHPDTLKAMHNLAFGYHSTGRSSDALPIYEEVLKLMQSKPCSVSPQVAQRGR